jgi:uncharacterized membrane protein YfcA
VNGFEVVSVGQGVWFGAILFFAAAVQAITGFGFGLLALALLGLVMDVRGASAAIAFVALFLNALLLAKYWRAFRFERVWPMIVATAAFAPIGVLFLQRAPSGSLLVVLGLVMVASFVQLRFAPKRARQPWHPVYLGVPCGVVGGWVGGAFGTGGPPLVAYLVTQDFPMPRYIASLQVAFGLASGARVVALAQSGFFTPPAILQVTAGCGAALLGMALGLWVARAVSKTALATGTVWFFGVMGAYYIVNGLMPATR